MSNDLIINVTLGETRVARLENGSIAELYVERASEASIVGNIYKGKVVRVLPGMEAAFVEVGLARTAFLPASDALPPTEDLTIEGRLKYRGRPIQEMLKEGAEVLVQTEKDPLGTKGARLTSFISLPGRYLVYMPTVDHVGISRRIEAAGERERLKGLIGRLRPERAGFIARTACEGANIREIKGDIAYLTRLWGDIEETQGKTKAPALIHAELDPVLRVVRDLFTSDISKLVIDSKAEFERVGKFVRKFMPSLKGRIEYYSGAKPIFDSFGIEQEVSRALGQKVWLKSGGYIIIEQTEALTTVDVNTGKFVGRKDIEETVLKTNLEAVWEIVYQLRLRNIGGIIVLDFIDMERAENRHKLFKALKEALKKDRARTTISKVSELGLIEMTRKRSREDLRSSLTAPCPYCEGKGYLKSPATVSYEIFREVERGAASSKNKELTVLAHPDVADIILNEERSSLMELEGEFKKRIIVKAMSEFHMEQFEVT